MPTCKHLEFNACAKVTRLMENDHEVELAHIVQANDYSVDITVRPRRPSWPAAGSTTSGTTSRPGGSGIWNEHFH
jgi:hypothetical protein